ncbi:hypothetical protein, partial [Escherichia coli]|uniref:hypothetical protein n=1 Tax=Escherichia coli TaxID=562 RepID=UPI001BC89F8F
TAPSDVRLCPTFGVQFSQRRIRQMCRPIVGCGVNTLFDLHTTHFPAKFAPHISLSINGFVTETIVFFYICLNLFLRYL